MQNRKGRATTLEYSYIALSIWISIYIYNVYGSSCILSSTLLPYTHCTDNISYYEASRSPPSVSCKAYLATTDYRLLLFDAC